MEIFQEFLPLFEKMESMHTMITIIVIGLAWIGRKCYEKYKDIELEKYKRGKKSDF